MPHTSTYMDSPRPTSRPSARAASRVADQAEGGQAALNRCTAGFHADSSEESRAEDALGVADDEVFATFNELLSFLSNNPTNVPQFEAVATVGYGVFDTLKSMAKAVLTELKKGAP